MPKQASVLVVQPFTHEGHSYVRGDRLMTTPLRALALRRKGLVTLTKGVTIERPPDPEPEPPRRRRAYRRRDMVADPE